MPIAPCHPNRRIPAGTPMMGCPAAQGPADLLSGIATALAVMRLVIVSPPSSGAARAHLSCGRWLGRVVVEEVTQRFRCSNGHLARRHQQIDIVRRDCQPRRYRQQGGLVRALRHIGQRDVDQCGLYVVTSCPVDDPSTRTAGRPNRRGDLPQLGLHGIQGLEVIAIDLRAADQPEQRERPADIFALCDRRILGALAVDTDHQYAAQMIIAPVPDRVG
jgi:hypothetical protein